MKNILKKLASRKLWLALAGIAMGLSMTLGADAEDISAVAGAVTALISAVTYILVEGKLDAERIKTAAEKTQAALEVFHDDGE